MSTTLQIDLYDEITAWSVRAIVDRLRANPDAEVLIRVNSPGGDVLEGFALANVIRSHKGRKTALVEGLAASAASFVLCACDEVRMFAESMLMVHAPWQPYGQSDASQLEEQAEVLRKMESLCVGLYQRKTGASEDQVRAWMARDSWMTPEEAKAAGFCDEILTAAPTAAARTRAARYLAQLKITPKTKDKTMAKATATENDGIPDGGAIPEHLRAKLAKHGLGEDPSHEEMMAAYDAYMEETDDGPDGRREMKRCMEKMKMAMEGDEPEAMDDDMDDEESSADKSKKMSSKLRQSAGLDPAVAKLVENLTGQVNTMSKKLGTYEARDAKRAEEAFYALAEKYTSREDAADYVAKCGGDHDKALALIRKLPMRGVYGRLFAGGNPVSGGAPAEAPAENTRVLRTGRGQTTTLNGIALAAMAKKKGGKSWDELAAAQLAVARERPDLYQPPTR